MFSDCTVTFSSDSIGGAGLSDNLTLQGAAEIIERIDIFIENNHTVDLRGWSFQLLAEGLGDATITGNAGETVLRGLGGADRLIGGGAADILVGGGGREQFIYTDLTDSLAGAATRDRILNFVSGADLIRVSAIDADQTTGGNQAFVEDTDGTLTAGELRSRESNGNTIIDFETDGAQGVDMQILVQNVVGLTAADLTL